MAIVELEGVSLRYQRLTPNARSLQLALYGRLSGQRKPTDRTVQIHALDNVSLTLAPGDRLGLIGPNGAGKTTLLRVVAGVCHPQEGRVRVEGRLASYTDFALGMDAEATGWDNIVFRCIFLGLTFSEARALAPSIGEFSGLGEYLDMPVRTYSSGMFIRLAFSITTAIQPEILVMDEMIGAADAEFLAKTEQRLKSIMESASILVITSHDTKLLMQLCNRVAWIDKGRIRQLGDPAEVIAAYHASITPPSTPGG